MTRRPSLPAWLRPAPTVFLLAWGGNHFTPLLHLYEAAGGYAPWQANLLLGTYVVGLVPGLLLAAALSDQHGRKPVLAGGLLAAATASVLLACGFETYWLLCLGRAIAGAGVGVAMSVGSSWIKELSGRPWQPRATEAAGARRSAMTLTLGFGIGAAVTGALAQWGPAPGQTPYLVHLALCVVAAVVLWTAPETVEAARRARGSWWSDLRVPSAGSTAFRRLVLPAAPWVFGAAGIAYAVMPAVVEPRLGRWATLYASVLTIAALGVGAAVQGLVPRLNRLTRGRALLVGLAGMTVGMALSAVAALLVSPLLALVVALVLGASYGVSVVAGLLIVQGIATPSDLAGLTGRYYSLTYVGFLLPAVLASIAPAVPYTLGLVAVAALCAASLTAVALHHPWPAAPGRTPDTAGHRLTPATGAIRTAGPGRGPGSSRLRGTGAARADRRSRPAGRRGGRTR